MMATPARITTKDLRDRLTDLALKASVFARGRGMSKQRHALMEAIKNTNAALRAEDAPNAISDPETHIRQYINAGGDWQAFVAAVNRLTYSATRNRK